MGRILSSAWQFGVQVEFLVSSDGSLGRHGGRPLLGGRPTQRTVASAPLLAAGCYRIVILAQIDEIRPADRHVVYGATTPADPSSRIRVVAIGGGVVVVRRDVQNRTGGEDRWIFVGVDDLPVEVVAVDMGQQLAAAVEMNRLQQHRLAAVVHVGLKADELRRARQDAVAVVPHVVGARRNGELVLSTPSGG